ncbi:hypothetical protein KI387_011010 [Taxus chinensis]|uniref:Heparan-alpha-glucosaminide N-acetyltransferase catalytic domain-containing protein n=1 Tax=Taxus chinensis TaxID=29808 RepID=A0AA38KKE3_TAXCH|nr:hypothetical protein KI387_011010 [Taxus chinensis]
MASYVLMSDEEIVDSASTTNSSTVELHSSDNESQLLKNGAMVTESHQRLKSLDIFRGLTVALMILVDDAGGALPAINHSPWDGVTLADFVMPFFLFIVGVALGLVYKNVPDKFAATRKAILRAIKLFILGVILQDNSRDFDGWLRCCFSNLKLNRNRVDTRVRTKLNGKGWKHQPKVEALNQLCKMVSIKTEGFIQDAFAQCIEELLSVMIEDVYEVISSSSSNVHLIAIQVGGYVSNIINEGQQGFVKIGERKIIITLPPRQ